MAVELSRELLIQETRSSETPKQHVHKSEMRMKRWEAFEIFGRLRRDVIVVYGPGGLSSELDAKSPSELNIYAPMPYPTSFGLGLAMALPKQKVVVMEGDGSVL